MHFLFVLDPILALGVLSAVYVGPLAADFARKLVEFSSLASDISAAVLNNINHKI